MDPFSALKTTLESVFHLVPMRNGKYSYPEIQQLKEAIENYQSDEKITFIKLVKKLGAALTHFEKLRVDFEPIKDSINSLAKIHQMPAVNWDKFLSHRKVSASLFNGLNKSQQDQDLIPWLSAITGETFTELKSSEQTSALIEHTEDLGFSNKLSVHLKKDPEFLLRLIMQSEKNFIKIANTRLILYLTDEQLAKTIIHYLPNLLQEQQNPLKQVEQLIDKLNGILSNGRSISTLLRNTEAKSILDNCDFFRIYQTDEYKNREEQPIFSSEKEKFKI